MAAFITGDWVIGELDTSVDGVFEGTEMAFTIYQADSTNPNVVSAILLDGSFSASGPFNLTAYDRQLNEVGSVVVARN